MKIFSVLLFVFLFLFFFSCSKPNEQPPKFEVSKTSLIIGDSVGGRSDSCFVETELTWTISFMPSKPTWLDINISGANGNDIIFIKTAETNNTGTSRTVTIILTPANPSVKPISVIVTQPPFTPKPKLETDSATLIILGRPGVMDSFSIHSNVSWTISSTPSWLQLSKTSGTGDAKIIATMLSGNYSSSDSNGAITITPINSPTLQPVSLLVKQQVASIIDIVWEKTYGGQSLEQFNRVIKTFDGGFVMAGFTKSNNGDITNLHGLNDGWLMKVDSNGSKLWQKTLGGSKDDSLTSVIQADDGGLVVCGYTSSNDGDITSQHGGSDAWVVKLSANGNLIWQTTIGGNANDYANSITKAGDGGYIVVGKSRSNDGDIILNQGNNDVLAAKLDANGNKVWVKTYGGSQEEYANSVIKTSDGNYLLAAFSNSTDGDLGSTAVFASAWLIKISENGNFIWHRSGSTLWQWHQDVKSVAEVNGEYVFLSFSGQLDADGHCFMYFVKFDKQGNLLLNKELHLECGSVNDIIADKIRGGFIIASNWNSGTSTEGRFIKISKDGNIIWFRRIMTSFGSFQSVVDSNDFFYFAGYTTDMYQYVRDSWLVKITPYF